MSSITNTKSHFTATRAAIYFGGLMTVVVISWFFLGIYPAAVAVAFNLTASLGTPALLGWIGWRLWKGRESKIGAAIKSAGLVFLAFPILTLVAVFAVTYLPTPSEDVLLRLVNLSPADRGIDDLECERSDANSLERNKVTCSFNVYVKGTGNRREYAASVDLQYNPRTNQWTRYERARF